MHVAGCFQRDALVIAEIWPGAVSRRRQPPAGEVESGREKGSLEGNSTGSVTEAANVAPGFRCMRSLALIDLPAGH